MLNGFSTSLWSNLRYVASVGGNWFKKDGYKFLATIVLGFAISMSVQWLIGTAMFAQLLSPLHSYLGSIMTLAEILAHPLTRTAISVGALVLSRKIVNSDRFQNLAAETHKTVTGLFKPSIQTRPASPTNTPQPEGPTLQEPPLSTPIYRGPIGSNQPSLTWLGAASVPAPAPTVANAHPTYFGYHFPGFERNEPRTLFSTMGKLFKAAVITLVPQKSLIWTSRILPIGGWIEDQVYVEMEDFHYAIVGRTAKDVQDLVDLMPKDMLYRMLDRRNSTNRTRLHSAALSKVESNEKCRILLKAISKEDRLRFLRAIIGQGDFTAPLIHSVIFKETEDLWDVAMEHLDPAQRKQLAWCKDQRGDSLLMAKARTQGAIGMVKVLQPLSIEERKAYLKELCPHGMNPLVQLFITFTLFASRDIFSVLPDKEDWQEVLNFRPKNWTMTLGEKIHLITASKVDNVNAKEKLAFLTENYGTKLTERYQALRQQALEERKIPFRKRPPNQYARALKEIRESLEIANCIIRHNFMVKHGEGPECLLGMEPHLEKAAYVPAFRRLQRQHHPDKNCNGTDMSTSLNAAKRFVSDEEARSEYKTPGQGDIVFSFDPSCSNGMKISSK